MGEASSFDQYAPTIVEAMRQAKQDQVDWVSRVKSAQGELRPTAPTSITNDDLLRRLEILKAAGVAHYKDDVLEITFAARTASS